MDQGWTLNEIDEMDIHYFLEVYRDGESEKRKYIDQINVF